MSGVGTIARLGSGGVVAWSAGGMVLGITAPGLTLVTTSHSNASSLVRIRSARAGIRASGGAGSPATSENFAVFVAAVAASEG